MKTLMAIIGLALTLTSTFGQISENFDSYGAQISTKDVVPTDELIANSEDATPVVIEGEVIETCANKGCWMKVKLDDGKIMRVTFKDYGFFVPTTGVEGKKTIIGGLAKNDITDVATLKHLAEDAGKSQEEIDKITSPKMELTFVADGVLISN